MYYSKDTLCFGGVCSRDYGAHLTGIQIADSPKRDVAFRSVPGRCGDLIEDNKRWSNVDITYSLVIPDNFAENFDAFKAALLSQDGYQELTDSIYPGYYRKAIVQQPTQPRIMRSNRAGTFNVTFHCKPQRFLKLGEQAVEFTAPGVLRNPTLFPAKPIVTIYGTGAGTVTVGDQTVIVKSIEDQITLDCDLQHAYRQVGEGAPENMNTHISAPNFPQLPAGENTVSWTGDIERVEIIPRWWTV